METNKRLETTTLANLELAKDRQALKNDKEELQSKDTEDGGTSWLNSPQKRKSWRRISTARYTSYSELEKQNSGLKEELADMRRENEGLMNVRKKLEKDVDRIRSERNSLQSDVDRIRKERNNQAATLKENKSTIDQQKKNIKDLEEEKAGWEQEAASLTNDLHNRDARLQVLTEERDKLSNERQSMEGTIDAFMQVNNKVQMENSQLKEEVAKVREKDMRYAQGQATANNEIRRLKLQRNEARDELRKTQEEMNKVLQESRAVAAERVIHEKEERTKAARVTMLLNLAKAVAMPTGTTTDSGPTKKVLDALEIAVPELRQP